MSVAVITGSGGLIGSEASRYFTKKGLDVVGIDNDMRQRFFGSEASTHGQVNRLPLVEMPLRWEIEPGHPYAGGVPKDMSIDQSLHSVFGALKVAADILVQEYGRYFDMYTACFRGGRLTGPNHAGTQLHGFLACLVRRISECGNECPVPTAFTSQHNWQRDVQP